MSCCKFSHDVLVWTIVLISVLLFNLAENTVIGCLMAGFHCDNFPPKVWQYAPLLGILNISKLIVLEMFLIGFLNLIFNKQLLNKKKENSYSQKTAICPILGQLAGSGHEVEKREQVRASSLLGPSDSHWPFFGDCVCVCESVWIGDGDKGRESSAH